LDGSGFLRKRRSRFLCESDGSCFGENSIRYACRNLLGRGDRSPIGTICGLGIRLLTAIRGLGRRGGARDGETIPGGLRKLSRFGCD
jgi:hypothetical protein